MNPDPQTWKFPVLAAFSSAPWHIQGIRELTLDEQVKLRQFIDIAVAARNRFKLFTILAKNYQQWEAYTQSLFTAKEGFTEDEMTELDRLQLNFFSSAKSLLDQFKQHWVHAHRKTERAKEYKAFIAGLEERSWAFAFFQDLRNFTQHCGLPTGNYARHVNINSITVRVEASSQWLLEHYENWDKSKLTTEHGQLNLLKLMREYYVCLQGDFGTFVATEFAPSLVDAHAFFAALAREVADLHPKAQFEILTSFTRAGSSLNFTFETPPSNLLGSIGITVTKS